MEVPKSEVEVEVLEPIIGGAIEQSPSSLGSKVPHLHLIHRESIAIIEGKMLVLVLQFIVDVLFVQGFGLVKVASPFPPFNGNFRIVYAINNVNNISICLSTNLCKFLNL